MLTGRGTAGSERRPIASGQLIVFGPGDHAIVEADDPQGGPLDVLLLGGLSIGAPIARHGPFSGNNIAARSSVNVRVVCAFVDS